MFSFRNRIRSIFSSFAKIGIKVDSVESSVNPQLNVLRFDVKNNGYLYTNYTVLSEYFKDIARFSAGIGRVKNSGRIAIISDNIGDNDITARHHGNIDSIDASRLHYIFVYDSKRRRDMENAASRFKNDLLNKRVIHGIIDDKIETSFS